MGPLIPNGIIPIEWDSIIAILIGLVFGFVLESSGFSSSRKLAGVFYGYDFSVLKVFFTACIVALIGIFYLDYLGHLELSQLYIHPTIIFGALVGGAIMGVGFVAAGFCPGTGLCAVAIGKIDGLVYIFGMLIGILITSELSVYWQPLNNQTDLGTLTITETLNLSPYWFILLFTISSILFFAIADKIAKKIKKVQY